MNLVNAEYGINVTFEDDTFNEIVVENPDSFASLVYQLYKGCEGKECDWILSDTDKILKMDKCIDIVDNPLKIDFNNRKVIGRLYSSMEEICNDNPVSKYEINNIVVKHLEDVINSLSYENITYDTEYDWSALFKLYNVKINSEDNSLIENIIEYVKVLSFLCKINIVIFVNLRSYLDMDGIIEFCKMASYCKVSVLLIESSEREKIPASNVIIIDRDNCMILK